ncbi:MAG: hypothetical protein HY377_01020 [Candidatus Blackburnbacteria bacterium]|nr:hypothetical protein [Candidatus Blackburnbacteria bacterium]
MSKNAPPYLSIGRGLSTMVGFPRIATWKTGGRPAKPRLGTVGFNTETKQLEIWNGTAWHRTSLAKV